MSQFLTVDDSAPQREVLVRVVRQADIECDGSLDGRRTEEDRLGLPPLEATTYGEDLDGARVDRGAQGGMSLETRLD